MVEVLSDKLITPKSIGEIVSTNEFILICQIMDGKLSAVGRLVSEVLSPIFSSRDAVATVLGVEPGEEIHVEATEFGYQGLIDLTLSAGKV